MAEQSTKTSYELHDGILYESTDACTCGNPIGPPGHEPYCGWEPLGPIEQMLDKAAAMAKVEELFGDGGPDTPIRTTWHEGTQYWEVPAHDMLKAMGVEVKPGCCTACKGTGSIPTEGPCSDCYGTGHPHPADPTCKGIAEVHS